MVTFVGIHHKKKKVALCSSTLSGKKIDAVIEKLNRECRKWNLFIGYEEIPKSKRQREQAIEVFRFAVKDEGLIVLLGKDVQKYFPYSKYEKAKIVKYRHPSFSSKSYSDDLYKKLFNTLKQV